MTLIPIKPCGTNRLVPNSSIVEEDPIFLSSPAAGITYEDIER